MSSIGSGFSKEWSGTGGHVPVPAGAGAPAGTDITVNASDGLMPADMERLKELRASGKTSLTVAIDRRMVDDDEIVDLTEMEVREAVEECGFPTKPVIVRFR